ncbi:CAZyme family GH3 [Aspergillus niger]|nr:CAZyme family GH3 [Aspergillus niger]KAI3088279.1 CAZyme family GH3 [Aspergillus niger]
MRVALIAGVASLLGFAGATSSSSTLGILKANGVELGEWEAAYEKASVFVANLTTAQKVALITGSSVESTKANFTAFYFLDGDMGLQDFYYVSAFSLSSALAMTWDRDAIYSQAKAVGSEFYNKGIQVVAGPTSQPLGRTVWGGRNVEGFGPDPYLNGLATGLTTKAYVDAGVIAGGKHFIFNEQETNRSASDATGAPYSSNVDDKATHETYLWPFYDAVKNGLGAVMCAMNKVNGTLACENSDLLMKTLKTELGFPGLVWPDFNAQSSASTSALGGEDYGSIRVNHSKLIRENGAKSMALLKNKNGALPLKSPHVMGIFGAHAGSVMGGPNGAIDVEGSGPTYQGHLVTGSGSGRGSVPYVITPLHALTDRASQDGTMLRWILNDTYTSTDSSSLVDSSTIYTNIEPSYANFATESSVCLVFLNALAGEGADRTELYNSDQDSMVNQVADNCNNTIVIINTVGPRLMDQWIDHDNVTAVLYVSLLGQESGNSIVDILYGDVNPSARLIHTIAKNESDYNVGICYTAQCNFTEGVYLDYRYFNKHDITPRYPFGHGLSYTTFDYSDLHITAPSSISKAPQGKKSVGGPSDLWDNVASVSVLITNNGTLAGAEVPQLYIEFPEAADQPVRQLRGFERVEIDAGGHSYVTFDLRRRDLSYWDVLAQEWLVASGSYNVYVGASSRDLRLNGTFSLTVTA